VNRFAATIAAIWRLSIPYFRSEDRWPGRILLAAVIALELSNVALQVILTLWYNWFYNALQDHDWSGFVRAILFFCVLAAIYTVVAVYQTYLNQWLQIRWRRWMTQTYLRQWLNSANHYRMQLLGDAADNPDQRIAEDLRTFVNYTLVLCTGLLNAIVSFCSFVVILWSLSAEAPLHLFGSQIAVPGYLVWAAIIYAIIGTVLTHLIGWRLVPLNFQQQRLEANFRFNLVRTRENAEQIAALHGEAAERERHFGRFVPVVDNWLAIMKRTKLLTFFTASYGQASVIFPFIMVSPAYFAGAMQLGGLMQTGQAFKNIQEALSYFVTSYRDIAEWRAIIDRLSGFQNAIEAGRAVALTPPAVEVVQQSGAPFTAERLDVRLPHGDPVVAADHLAFPAGERILVTGPSGAGKSTLFRAIAGIWPFGSGHVTVPAEAKVMLVPQRPYFPIAPLGTAIAFPARTGTFNDATIAEAVAAVGLPGLADRLGEEAHWNSILSLGEQQRLAIARALLHAPDYLFLDEATASLDEPAEAAVYRLLQDRLKGATIISIGHRSTLGVFHHRRVELVPEGASWYARELPLASAAE
jgi:vitamin B12/bleomycin/antimicrobial peptide transport system ATP-binding/permease protein